MVARIRHDIISLLVNNNTGRGRELPITVPIRSKNTKKGSLFIKDLNAVVVAISHHDLVVPLVDSHTSRKIKLAISPSL